MKESFEHDVKCWFPENPEQQDYAVLKFDPTYGVTLKVTGKLVSDETSTFPIIQCATFFGKPFTLFDNEPQNTRGFSEGSTTYSALYMLEGVHCDKEIELKQFNVKYTHLDEWLDVKVMDWNSDYELEDKEIVTFRNIDIIESETNNGKLLIFPTYQKSWKRRPESIDMYIDWTVNFELQTKKTLPSFLADTERKFRNFITLGLDSLPSIKSIQGLSDNFQIELSNGKMVSEPIGIYYSQGEQIAHRKFNPFHMTFAYKDFAGDLGKYLKKWYDSYQLFDSVIDLYFGVMSNNRMYLLHAFLSLVQGLEVYHRRSTGLNKPLKVGLLDILDTKNNWLASLIEKHPEKLAEELKNTRHYLTHYDKKYLKKVNLSSENFLFLINAMKLMTQFCFFKELGFSDELIKKLVTRNSYKQRGYYSHNLYS